MRPSRTITGLVTVLLLAGCAPTNTGSPPSSTPTTTTTTSDAEQPTTTTSDAPPSSEGEVKVDLAKGRGITLVGDRWYIHTSFSFTVTTTAPQGESAKDPLNVVLSFPSDAITVFSTDGEGWSCQDVETGLSCTHADPAKPGEAWPALTVNAGPPKKTTSDESLSVEASGPGKGTATVQLDLDTST